MDLHLSKWPLLDYIIINKKKIDSAMNSEVFSFWTHLFIKTSPKDQLKYILCQIIKMKNSVEYK